MADTSETRPVNEPKSRSGGPSPQLGRPNGPSSGRNRRKKAPKEGTEINGNDTKNTANGDKKPRNQKKPKPKGDAKDFRLLEVVKLIRKHLPITINGYAVAKILELKELAENNTPEGLDTPKKQKPLSRKAKEAILVEHIDSVLKRDPQQSLYLSFIMKPADPDFPFELDLLNFNLTIPAEYPRNNKSLPSIIVLNTEIPKGFSVNIERGFRTIANLAKNSKKVPADELDIQLVDGKGLLSQVQTLNKYLELFLQQEKRQTMKFVTFKNSSKASVDTKDLTPKVEIKEEKAQEKVDLAAAAFVENVNVTETTRLKREYYIGEMVQKLEKKAKLFNRSKAEARYKVQIPIVSAQNIPELWTYQNTVIDVFVTVPNAYPEIPIRVIVASNFTSNLLVAKKNSLVSENRDLIALVDEARKAEKNLNLNVSEYAGQHITGLVQHLNWISNHLHVLVKLKQEYEEWASHMARLAAAT